MGKRPCPTQPCRTSRIDMLGLEVLAMWTSALWVGEGGALSWTTAEPRCRARQVAIRKSILRPGAPQGDQVEDRPTGRRRPSFSGSGTSVIPSRTWGDSRMRESSTDASLTFQNCRTSSRSTNPDIATRNISTSNTRQIAKSAAGHAAAQRLEASASP